MNVDKKRLLGYISRVESVTATDVSNQFNIPLGTASQRLRRLASKGVLDTEKVGRERFYSFRSKSITQITSAQLGEVINWMVRSGHPYLKYVPVARGGYNEGGGYVYHWAKFLEILDDMAKEGGDPLIPTPPEKSRDGGFIPPLVEGFKPLKGKGIKCPECGDEGIEYCRDHY